MIEISYLLAPLVGGVIGYITNDIAIRMLFRPHSAKYLMGIHIPFTPGIIPKEKSRIAETIGSVISENLMNSEVLQRYLLSDDMVNKISAAVESFINRQKSNSETVEEFLARFLSTEEITTLKHAIKNNLTTQVEAKLVDSSLGDRIAHLAMDHVVAKFGINGTQEIMSGLGNTMKGVSGMASALFGSHNIIGKFLEMLREPTEKYLAKNINAILRTNGHEIVTNLVGNGIDTFMSTSMADHLAHKEEQIRQLIDFLTGLYKTIVKKYLPDILASVDISKIVRERLDEMDVAETEKLIFKVMNKELKAIVWLGALLGLIMGSINILI